MTESSVDGNGGERQRTGRPPGRPPGPVFDANNPPPPPHNGDQWGDIIPPFDENGQSTVRPEPHAQLEHQRQAIFENGCNPVDFGNVAVQKLVDNPDDVHEPGDVSTSPHVHYRDQGAATLTCSTKP